MRGVGGKGVESFIHPGRKGVCTYTQWLCLGDHNSISSLAAVSYGFVMLLARWGENGHNETQDDDGSKHR